MPINKKYPLKELIKAIRYYTDKKKKRVTFEYVLIKGINNRPADVRALVNLLKGIPCKINLIPFNPYPKTKFLSPNLEEMQEFADMLYPELPAVTIRKSRGAEILAACGQLAGKK